MRRVVILKKAYGLNNAGEICNFPIEEADALIKAGAAVACSKKQLEEAKAAIPRRRVLPDRPPPVVFAEDDPVEVAKVEKEALEMAKLEQAETEAAKKPGKGK